MTRNRAAASTGFTLIEVLVVLAITGVLMALGTLSLGRTQSTANLSSVTSSLLADIKSQQLLAMSGKMGSGVSQQSQGIYIQASSYTLFTGTTYSAVAPGNFTVNTDPCTLSTTFAGNQVVFAKGDGGVVGFAAGNNTITVDDQGTSKTITINRFGAITIN